MGENGYNLIFKNCQHFAYDCRNAVERSYEVSDALNKIN